MPSFDQGPHNPLCNKNLSVEIVRMRQVGCDPYLPTSLAYLKFLEVVVATSLDRELLPTFAV